MKNKAEILKKKYHKVPDIRDLKELLYNGAKFGNKVAFRVKDEFNNIIGISYKTFKEDVEALATMLIKKGFSNKAIAVTGKNSYNWCVSYMAAALVGTVVPIDKELHFEDIINFLNASETKIILGDSKILDEIEKNKNMLKDELVFVRFEKDFKNKLEYGYSLISGGDKSFEDIQIDRDAPKILLFTSGTTGSAKGVCLSHKNICSNIMSIAQIVKVNKSTVVMSVLPLHHTYECTVGFLLIIFGGGTITYCEGLRHVAQNMNEYKPTFLLCVPLLLENMYSKIQKSLEKSLPKKYFKEDKNIMDTLPFYLKGIVKRKIRKSFGGRLKTFIVGAAAISPELIGNFFKLGFRALQGYGLTECSPLVVRK